MNVHVLQLSKSGQPLAWLNREQAATLYAKSRVLWELGECALQIKGGINSVGVQSQITMASIIACEGKCVFTRRTPALTNRLLFRRDAFQCMYCGKQAAQSELTRDHVIPRAQGGKDRWENVVAACQRCNHSKGNRTPEQAAMPLLAVPFVPNPFEYLYLENRHILADQMEFLASSFSTKRSWS